MKIPFLLLLDGMTGTGKSTTSRLLAKQIPRLATIGIDNVKLLISDFERGDRDNNLAREIIFTMTKIYFEHNISVIVEGVRRDEIGLYEDLAKTYSIPVYKIELYASPVVVFERIVERMKSWENPTSEEQVRKNIAHFNSKKDIGFIQIDTVSLQSKEVSEQILKIISS